MPVAVPGFNGNLNKISLSLTAMTKYILVAGGVVSGIGKGVIGTRFLYIPAFDVGYNGPFQSIYQLRLLGYSSKLLGSRSLLLRLIHT